MDADNIRFNALRNALYQTARRRWFEAVARWLNLVVILLGTAAVGNAVAGVGVGAAAIGMLVAVVGALQLVFDFGRQARDHQVLQREYFRLLADIDATSEPSPAELARWRGQLMLIAADEPPVMRAVDAKAYNDAIDALGVFPATERLVIPLWQTMFGRFLSFEGYNYRKVGETA